MFIGFYSGIREPRVYLYHFPPECAGPPCSAASTYAVSLDRSNFFHIWFLQNQIFQYCPLDFDRKNVYACTSNIHQDGVSKEVTAKGGDPIGGANTAKRAKKVATPRKNTATPKSAQELWRYRSRQHRGKKELPLVPSLSSWKGPNLDHQYNRQCKPISPLENAHLHPTH